MTINCPNCHTVLESSELEPKLVSHHCPKCDGHWVRLAHYVDWVKEQTIVAAVVEEINIEVEVDNTTPLLCAKTQEPLIPFTIISDVNHRIDWGQTRKAFWVSQAEWTLMKEKRVANKLIDIFSTEMQSQLEPLQNQLNREHFMIKNIGKENYSRLKLMRSWLHEQSPEHKALIVSFLTAEDPFNSTD